MPIKFDIVDGRVLVRATDLLIREFRAIWDADKTKNKDEASAHLAFLSLYCDLEGAFSDIDYREKEQLVKGNVYGDSDYKFSSKWLPLINDGLKAFIRYNANAERRLLPVYTKKIDQIRSQLEEIEPVLVDTKILVHNEATGYDDEVEVKANIKDIMDIMTKLDSVIITKEKIEARVMKKPESKNRGAVETSLLEEGLLGIKPLNNAG